MNNQRGIKEKILNEMKVLRIITFIVMMIAFLLSLRTGIHLDNFDKQYPVLFGSIVLFSIFSIPDIVDSMDNNRFSDVIKNRKEDKISLIKLFCSNGFFLLCAIFLLHAFQIRNLEIEWDKTFNIVSIGLMAISIPYMAIDIIFQKNLQKNISSEKRKKQLGNKTNP